MRLWIVALLDPEPIEKANKDRHNTAIQMPPKFDVSKVQPVLLPPSSALRSTRSRASRSASPSKIATPSRKMASPRKSRATRHSAKADAVVKAEETKTESTTAASSALQNVMENGTTVSESVATESVAPEESVNGDSVRIEVQETVEQNGDVETTTTNVKVEVPADHPDLPVPENPEDMIATAKKMVEEAKALEGNVAVNGIKPSKRKVEEIKDEDDDDEADKAEDQRAKRARVEVTEQALRKERMAKKALAAVTIIGAVGFVALSLHYPS